MVEICIIFLYRQRYEGANIYTIYSTGDDKVGFMACGRKASEIVGENGGFQVSVYVAHF
jgi:hypothetical protein